MTSRRLAIGHSAALNESGRHGPPVRSVAATQEFFALRRETFSAVN
jgi:hypothetical protein